MTLPLMPKATAVWLVENTALTFQQIADFCGLHELEVQAIADGEVAAGMQGWDPVGNGQLTREEIARCEADPALRLKLIKANIPLPQAKGKGPRYTPISRRQDKPNAIAWLIRTHPELSDAQVSRAADARRSRSATRDARSSAARSLQPVMTPSRLARKESRSSPWPSSQPISSRRQAALSSAEATTSPSDHVGWTTTSIHSPKTLSASAITGRTVARQASSAGSASGVGSPADLANPRPSRPIRSRSGKST